ncbi:Mariner Mos1 transposase [Eumeta japonica]|uniref:Mariner Mos1 transposase n=1 Tax=Eumeta variegata TaxID=151549 RepID=A0A4C1XV85_EUMVA|nr:Mariner Mos1 transposase [Eumeta japonica]
MRPTEIAELARGYPNFSPWGMERSSSIAKPGLIRNKLMLCVWWDWKGIIHYELLPPDKTINSNLSCQQLVRLKQVEKERPELINKKRVYFHAAKFSTISTSGYLEVIYGYNNKRTSRDKCAKTAARRRERGARGTGVWTRLNYCSDKRSFG